MIGGRRIDHWHFLRNDLIIQRFLMLMQYPYDAKRERRKRQEKKERKKKEERRKRERRKTKMSELKNTCLLFCFSLNFFFYSKLP